MDVVIPGNLFLMLTALATFVSGIIGLLYRAQVDGLKKQIDDWKGLYAAKAADNEKLVVQLDRLVTITGRTIPRARGV